MIPKAGTKSNSIMEGNIANIETIRANVYNRNPRSAWNKGVKEYALALIEELEWNVSLGYIDESVTSSRVLLEKALLNGAADWSQYSWGGCAFCYDEQIARCLCNPTELKKTRNGHRKPNRSEEWLDVQARALFQAAMLIIEAAKEANRGYVLATLETGGSPNA